MKIVVIDNYDSFTYNLVQAMGALGARVDVLRNREPLARVQKMKPDAIVISPGPGRPEDSGLTLEVLRGLSPTLPTLGICLGHQAMGLAYGAKVTHAPRLMHGKTCPVHHDGRGVFQGLPSPLTATRYHSLIVTDVKSPLVVTAKTDIGEVMGLRHKRYPIEGLQFHPESVATEGGKRMLQNFAESV
ncbi:MAG: aminodeoxychorismate/anthranilate synthase component II [Euryarchaeota archaeon]|nr:aminodeoxychorismate/anthranilate synthase component II [Euryarchaeota archaeon]